MVVGVEPLLLSQHPLQPMGQSWAGGDRPASLRGWMQLLVMLAHKGVVQLPAQLQMYAQKVVLTKVTGVGAGEPAEFEGVGALRGWSGWSGGRAGPPPRGRCLPPPGRPSVKEGGYRCGYLASKEW